MKASWRVDHMTTSLYSPTLSLYGQIVVTTLWDSKIAALVSDIVLGQLGWGGVESGERMEQNQGLAVGRGASGGGWLSILASLFLHSSGLLRAVSECRR